jgi:hypothetical protein
MSMEKRGIQSLEKVNNVQNQRIINRL